MPKKNGITKSYSFSQKTIQQIEELCEFEMLKPTNLIEHLINIRYREYSEKYKTAKQ